jgi:uncharacterized protein YbbC (DUF1343 family)
MRKLEAVAARALAKAVRDAGAPGAVAWLGHRDSVAYSGAAGNRSTHPTAQAAALNTPYDLASLTKVVATTTAAMQLVERGALDLAMPVFELVPLPNLRGVTVRHLLTHTSGLPAHKDLYREVNTADAMLARIGELDLSWAPGTRRRYSDFGFMLLARIVSLTAKDSFDAYCAREIFVPLGMTDTAFNPPPPLAAHAAATEQCAWRGRLLQGEVHDENAAAMGGVSGHAGLFSTAPDLAKFCEALLSGGLLRSEALDQMLRPAQVPGYAWQGLGWKLDGWMSGNEGYLPSRWSFGHTGWTGTSLWLDRDTGRYAILLSNTCHPTRANRDNVSLRQVFHIPVSRAWYPRRTNAQTGLDQLAVDEFDALRGKRVGLLTNVAAVNAHGVQAQHLLRDAPGVQLRHLFGPEHGLRTQAEAGASVASETGSVPVTSLYGDRTAPTPEELARLDMLVVDLPDVGARYYTYAATLLDCMRACAAANKPVLVLDRPNPLGGEIVEGPVAQVFGRNVCVAPMPVRHGMTLGELALFMHRALAVPGDAPRVIPADNWPRELMWYDSGLPWRPPSPNLPDADTALLYIGNALFEGVNISEGRGTGQPFQLIGAPWLDPARVLENFDAAFATGVEITPATFTPRPIAGKSSSPRFNGETCKGFRFALYDRDAARPFMMIVALLRAIARTHGPQLEFLPFFDTLAGGPWLREQILADAPLDGIASECARQCAEFQSRRIKLYASSQELITRHLGT